MMTANHLKPTSLTASLLFYFAGLPRYARKLSGLATFAG
jgi:hypothetical protein